MKKIIATAELDPEVEQLIQQVRQGRLRVTLEEDGQQVAAIISMADFERLRHFDEEIQEGLKLLEQLRAPFKDIPPDQIEREVRGIIAEVRREQHGESAASQA